MGLAVSWRVALGLPWWVYVCAAITPLLGISSASQNPVTRADPSGMARHGYPSMHVTYSVANRRSRPIKYNSITFRIALNKQKVIAILGATATVVRGADGHKTNLFLAKETKPIISKVGVFYFAICIKQLDIVQWSFIISTPSFVLRWKQMRKQGGKSLSSSTLNVPFLSCSEHHYNRPSQGNTK